jgi:micrococcal nuclease
VKNKIILVLVVIIQLQIFLSGCDSDPYINKSDSDSNTTLEIEEKSAVIDKGLSIITTVPETGIPDYDIVTLERVVDGDTLIVNINDEEYTVRLIGIDCEESVNPNKEKNSEEGREASRFTKSIISNEQTLYMTVDTSDTDMYGRLLRYVWTETPDPNNIDTTMLNAIILSEGYAVAKDYEPDTYYSELFHDIQDTAEEQRKGLWEK